MKIFYITCLILSYTIYFYLKMENNKLTEKTFPVTNSTENQVKIVSLEKKRLKEKLLPFILTAIVILADQITKLIIVKTIPHGTIGSYFFGDINDAILRIVHVSNPGVAFSLGAGWSQNIRTFLFSVMPIVVIAVVVNIYFRNNLFTKLDRWCIAGIVGGGIGNLIDRIFRPEGVVDFIDVKFFGIFGLERWPVFNVADAAVVICGAMLIVSFVIESRDERKVDIMEHEIESEIKKVSDEIARAEHKIEEKIEKIEGKLHIHHGEQHDSNGENQ